MQLKKPHGVKDVNKYSHPPNAADREQSPRRGWIDLGKTKKQAAVLLAIVAISAVVFGVAVKRGRQFTAADSDQNSVSWLESLNPFAPPTVVPNRNLMLAREYLYAQEELLAVEDAGATSVPPADLAIWRPSSGQWWTMAGQSSTQVTVQWGIASDKPAIGDYDADGKTDFCVFRPSEGRWYLISSSSGDSSTSIVTFGQNGDHNAAADYDGDGQTDFAVWRPSNGNFYIKRSSDGGVTQVRLGTAGDVPSPNDYDGDGKADLAVWRPANSTFYSVNSSDGEMVFTSIGISGTPVSADYDGDGRADFAVRNGVQWKIQESSTGQIQYSNWQQAGDLAVQNDYDGDGRVDIATFRPVTGTWYIKNSSNGLTRTEQWGTNGDIPLPALYRR
jgi:hypothetical protein